MRRGSLAPSAVCSPPVACERRDVLRRLVATLAGVRDQLWVHLVRLVAESVEAKSPDE